MKGFFSIFLCIFLSLPAALGQTKLIAMKSRSGKAAEFSVVGKDNFGMAPNREIEIAKLDTLQYLNDSQVVMVTSYHCIPVQGRGKKGLWDAGRDTALNHPLFSLQHNLDSIKRELEKYNFQNAIDSVVFIGYDNSEAKEPVKQKKCWFKRKTKKKKEGIIAILQNNKMLPYLFLMIGVALFLFFYTSVLKQNQKNFEAH